MSFNFKAIKGSVGDRCASEGVTMAIHCAGQQHKDKSSDGLSVAISADVIDKLRWRPGDDHVTVGIGDGDDSGIICVQLAKVDDQPRWKLNSRSASDRSASFRISVSKIRPLFPAADLSPRHAESVAYEISGTGLRIILPEWLVK